MMMVVPGRQEAGLPSVQRCWQKEEASVQVYSGDQPVSQCLDRVPHNSLTRCLHTTTITCQPIHSTDPLDRNITPQTISDWPFTRFTFDVISRIRMQNTCCLFVCKRAISYSATTLLESDDGTVASECCPERNCIKRRKLEQRECLDIAILLTHCTRLVVFYAIIEL